MDGWWYSSYAPRFDSCNTPISDDGGANGIILTGTKGIMTIGMYGNNPKIYLNNGEVIDTPKLTNDLKLPEYGHQVSWTNACKAGFASKEHRNFLHHFDYSGPLTETVLMGNLAIQ